MLDFSQNIILCDTSYMVFYRYFSLVSWWKISKRNVEDLSEYPIEFSDKFEKTFMDMIQRLGKTYGVPLSNIVFVKDCSREDIWRNDIYIQYKGTRTHAKTFNPEVFVKTYTKTLPKLCQQHGCHVISGCRLEADDCIALLARHLRRDRKFEKDIIVITNDNDYIQLHKHNVMLRNLQGKCLYDRVGLDADTYLHQKQIMGDTSDNIIAIAPKIGPKTALKIIRDENIRNKYLSNPETNARYELNKRLVDFDCIPDDLSDAFMTTSYVTALFADG